MKKLIGLLAVSALLLLTSCGGGGGCAGTPTNGTNTCTSAGSTTTTTPGAVPAVAKFIYTLDKNTINNAGSDVAQLTITALDASNNVIVGVPVTVALSSGSYVATTPTTDAQGNVSGKIGIGGDYSNRAITATFTDGKGVSGTAGIIVTGAALSITAPTAPAVSAALSVTVKATNVTGAGVANASIQLSGAGFTGTLTTDLTGAATATFTAPATPGTYSLTATGLGVTQSVSMLVGSAAAIPSVPAGTISGFNLAINPVVMAPNTAGSITNQAQLKALFTNAQNQAIPNVRVRFEFDPLFSPSGSVGEFITSGATTVYSDTSGAALSNYIAGTTASATNGVHIRACYGYTDADIAGGLCPFSVLASLTVASAPVSLTLASNNLLVKDGTGTLYTQTLLVLVNDAAGVAVSGATISGSVDITHYAKGYSAFDPYYISTTTTLDTQLLTPPAYGQTGISATDVPMAGTAGPPVIPGQRVWCANEDYNRNGILDATVAAGAPAAQFPGGKEDVNGNGILDPRKADVLIAFPFGNKTDAKGVLVINVTWPMNVATWEAYTVKVSTMVSGTEGLAQQTFITGALQQDVANGSFLTPAYGVNNCSTPN